MANRSDARGMRNSHVIPAELRKLLTQLGIDGVTPSGDGGKLNGNEADFAVSVDPYHVAEVIEQTIHSSSRILTNFQYRVLSRILGLELKRVRELQEQLTPNTLAWQRARRKRTKLVDALVRLNQPLVGQAIKKWEPRDHDTGWGDDYRQAGLTGLAKAIDTWDPDSGTLDSWARFKLQQEIHAAVHQNEYPHLTKSEFALRGRMLSVERRLKAARGGGQVTLEDVADEMGVDVERLRAIVARSNAAPSLHEPVYGEESDVELQDYLAETESFEDELLDQLEDQELLERIYSYIPEVLSDDELFVLCLRYGIDAAVFGNETVAERVRAALDSEEEGKLVPFKVIASEIGKSREGARQKVKAAESKIRHPLVLSGVAPDDLAEAA